MISSSKAGSLAIAVVVLMIAAACGAPASTGTPRADRYSCRDRNACRDWNACRDGLPPAARVAAQPAA